MRRVRAKAAQAALARAEEAGRATLQFYGSVEAAAKADIIITATGFKSVPAARTGAPARTGTAAGSGTPWAR